MKIIIPQKVDGYRQEVINGLIDCVTALWPRRSATILCNVTANGTDYEVKRPAAGGADPVLEDFSFKKTVDADIYIYGGTIKFSGRGSAIVPEDTHVTVTGGTKYAPVYICLRMSTTGGPGDWALTCSATDPDDDGTFLFRVLHLAYLSTAGKAVWLRKANQWVVRSPL